MSNTTQVKSLLEKLDIDSDLITLLETERITKFRKMENLNEENLADTMTKPLNGKKLRGLWKPYLFRSPQG